MSNDPGGHEPASACRVSHPAKKQISGLSKYILCRNHTHNKTGLKITYYRGLERKYPEINFKLYSSNQICHPQIQGKVNVGSEFNLKKTMEATFAFLPRKNATQHTVLGYEISASKLLFIYMESFREKKSKISEFRRYIPAPPT